VQVLVQELVLAREQATELVLVSGPSSWCRYPGLSSS